MDKLVFQMAVVTKFSDFRKTKPLFSREHDRIIAKYDINLISLKGVKIPLICLYNIVSSLFENNSINLKISDIILLTITSIAILSKDDKTKIKELLDVLSDKKVLQHILLVKNSIKSIKNLMNIVLKKDGVVIQNIEQALKYRFAVDVLSITHNYISFSKIKIKDFCYWYIVSQRNKESNDLLNYVNINY